MKPGLFVSFEGIEGCGKTTQIARLSEHLQTRRIPHTLTREPGGTSLGEGIRRILLDPATGRITPESELLLFYASRGQNIVEKIRPALERGEMVISDRYFDASMAYQGYGRDVPLEFIRELTGRVCGRFRPDLTLVLDIDPALGLRRARRRNSAAPEDEGRFEAEDLAFYRRVRDGYLDLARREPGRIVVIPAEGEVDAVHASVIEALPLEGT